MLALWLVTTLSAGDVTTTQPPIYSTGWPGVERGKAPPVWDAEKSRWKYDEEQQDEAKPDPVVVEETTKPVVEVVAPAETVSQPSPAAAALLSIAEAPTINYAALAAALRTAIAEQSARIMAEQNERLLAEMTARQAQDAEDDALAILLLVA